MENPGLTARDEALDLLTLANVDWIGEAVQAIGDMVRSGRREVTSDDVWRAMAALGIPAPREPRALGAAMVAARKAGLIETTPETRQSTRASNHGRFIRVWRAKGA